MHKIFSTPFLGKKGIQRKRVIQRKLGIAVIIILILLSGLGVVQKEVQQVYENERARALNITYPAENEVLTHHQITVNWTFDQQAGDHFQYCLYHNGDNVYCTSTTYKHFTYNFEDGLWKVEVYAYDINNNYLAGDTVNFTVEADPPNITIGNPHEGDILNKSSVNVQWNGSDGNGIEHYDVKIDNGPWINVSLNTSYVFTNLSDGSYTVFVRGFDSYGLNTTVSVNFTVEIFPPTIEITYPHNEEYTNKSSVVVQWTGYDGNGMDHYEIKMDNGEWHYVSADTASYTFVNLGEGSHTAFVKGYDTLGYNSTESATFTVDTHPPQIFITFPHNNAVISTNSTQVTWSGNDNTGIDYYEIKVDGKNWSNVGKNTSYTIAGLSDGPHKITVRAHDKASNSAVNSVSMEVDTVPPEYQNGSIVPHYSGDGNAMVWVNATDNVSGVSFLYYSFDRVNWVKIAYVHSFHISYTVEGKAYIYMVFQDVAGHNSSLVSLNYTVDLSPPTGSLELNETYNSLNITIHLNASDNITWVEYFRYSTDNGSWSEWIHYTSQYVMEVHTSGVHRISVQYMDYVGHISHVYSSTTTVLLALPSIDFSVKNATANNTVGWKNITINITGYSDVGLKQMRIMVNESETTVYDSGWIGCNATYTIHITATGYYSITVYVKDRAGDEANASHIIYVDLDAPVIKDIDVQHCLISSTAENITVNATDFSGILRYGYELNGTLHWFSSNTFTLNLPHAEGNYTITLYVEDIFGHMATANTWVCEVQHENKLNSTKPSQSAGFPWHYFLLLLLLSVIIGIVLYANSNFSLFPLLRRKENKEEEGKERELSTKEMTILQRIISYVREKEGAAREDVIKTVSTRMGISEEEVATVLDWGKENFVLEEREEDGVKRMYTIGKEVE